MDPMITGMMKPYYYCFEISNNGQG